MKALRIKTIVKKDEDFSGYNLINPKYSFQTCHLCEEMYNDIVGKEVVGNVTFILKKIKGKPTDYINPFRIVRDDCCSEDVLQVHDGKTWEYAKWIYLMDEVIDIEQITEWAGEDMFALEMEWI
jgi:hypothetical protein